MVYHARIHLKSTDTSCDRCFTSVYKNLSGKSIYKTYKSKMYLFLTKVVFCQIWTNLTFYTSFETYTCFYNAPSIEMLHYKMFSINKYRFSYRHTTTHNITFLHVAQTSHYGMTQKMYDNVNKNWQSWNYAQSPLLSSFKEFSSSITKYRQKSWKKQWLTTKVNIPILQHTRKKNGPHEYSASIEINMHEICYGSYYPYSTCWVIPMKLYKPLCSQIVNSAWKRTPVQQNTTYPDAGYLDCQLSRSAWPLV